MYNQYTQLKELLKEPPLVVGEVVAASGDLLKVELPGGTVIDARGPFTAGTNVYVKGGVAQGAAPSMTSTPISV